MEGLKLWISGICTVSLIVVILKALLPDNVVGKTFNITASLVILLVTVTPIKRFDFEELGFAVKKNDDSVKDKVEEAVGKTNEITDKIIEDKICEYICNKTGLDVKEIDVDCEEGVIKRGRLYKENPAVREILNKDCGIADDIIKSGE